LTVLFDTLTNNFGNILPGMRRKVNISTLMVFRNQRRRRTNMATAISKKFSTVYVRDKRTRCYSYENAYNNFSFNFEFFTIFLFFIFSFIKIKTW
jgi:hypothetical protein